MRRSPGGCQHCSRRRTQRSRSCKRAAITMVRLCDGFRHSMHGCWHAHADRLRGKKALPRPAGLACRHMAHCRVHRHGEPFRTACNPSCFLHIPEAWCWNWHPVIREDGCSLITLQHGSDALLQAGTEDTPSDEVANARARLRSQLQRALDAIPSEQLEQARLMPAVTRNLRLKLCRSMPGLLRYSRCRTLSILTYSCIPKRVLVWSQCSSVSASIVEWPCVCHMLSSPRCTAIIVDTVR